MKIKAERNFGCNKTKKKAGEFLTDEEIKDISGFIETLEKDGVILVAREAIKKPVEKKVEKKSKKKVEK
ncbi:hypothetical protein KAR91_40760 [Candidatus Pacearchaeota archaeon]|nr:hypothetical protein [Candidatus Pacearchaeota archaeon]